MYKNTGEYWKARAEKAEHACREAVIVLSKMEVCPGKDSVTLCAHAKGTKNMPMCEDRNQVECELCWTAWVEAGAQ